MDSNSEENQDLLNAVTFFGSEKTRFGDLSRFEKRLRIPEEFDQRIEYMGRLAEPELAADLDAMYDRLKTSFAFKRKQIVVTNPVDGSAAIATPAFEYRIDLTMDESDEKHVYWRRSVCKVQDPECLFGDEFQKVFGKKLDALEVELTDPLDVSAIIDHVEDLESDGIEIDYDRAATWCRINLDSVFATIIVEAERIRVECSQRLEPAELFKCYREFQVEIMSSLETGE